MTKYSQHPEVQIRHELREAVERVAGGIERVIVLTDAAGEPLAALVSMSDLQRLEESDTADDDATADELDRSNIRPRQSS